MKISSITFDQLKTAGVNVPSLLEDAQSAVNKRDRQEVSLSQSAKKFSVKTPTEDIQRNNLNDHEDYAGEVKSFDDACLKIAKKWGTSYTWIVPDTMVKNCLTMWPMVGKPAELVKA